jgi:tetratricopeptide (TPR) repeat protein
LVVAAAAARTRQAKPVAFGIIWFIVTLLPTSLMPLGDVTNDHRMFFSFVGLTLTVFWSLRLALFRVTARLTANRRLVYASVGALAVVLIIAGAATRARNRVWLTEESLWLDAVTKNPRDVRALTNYGAYADAQADYPAALSYWERAAALDPSCGSCEVNLAKVSVQLNRGDLADRHMKRVLAMFPSEPDPYIAYAEWLLSAGRFEESCRLLGQAAPLFPHSAAFWRAHLKVFQNRDAAARNCLFQALDTDHDTRLSAWEIVAAPAVLLTLDKNGDGKLSAEECGVRRELLRSDPLFRALDANYDGEISASEIQDAKRALLTLDRDRDGALEAPEMVPDYVTAAARRILALPDANRERFRGLLAAADIDGNGTVTLEEATNEIFYRADRNKDGIVTPEEMNSWWGGSSVSTGVHPRPK